MVTVELNMDDFVHHRNDALLQFAVRQKLIAAGIPLGPWGTSQPKRGVLEWYDDKTRPFIRVVKCQGCLSEISASLA